MAGGRVSLWRPAAAIHTGNGILPPDGGPWTVFEWCHEREGKRDQPVSEALARGGGSHQPINRLLLLRTLGWPEAIQSLRFENLGAGLWMLKCKPGPWRLWLVVDVKARAFTVVHAVAKKKWERDPDDTGIASRRAKRFAQGEAGRVVLPLPGD